MARELLQAPLEHYKDHCLLGIGVEFMKPTVALAFLILKYKSYWPAVCWWLTPVILATWEACDFEDHC
jgi:hypothetical protein